MTIHEVLARTDMYPPDWNTGNCNTGVKVRYESMYQQKLPEIKDVIFNEPATIVLWSDGTKTVVKCQEDDIFDPEKGLTMAISKKALGNKGNYCNVIKKWTEGYVDKDVEALYPLASSAVCESLKSVGENAGKCFREYIQRRFNKKEGNDE